MEPVAEAGFPRRGGAANPQGGDASLLFGQFFSWELHENERNWTWSAYLVPPPPPDPPMGTTHCSQRKSPTQQLNSWSVPGNRIIIWVFVWTSVLLRRHVGQFETVLYKCLNWIQINLFSFFCDCIAEIHRKTTGCSRSWISLWSFMVGSRRG